jgi:hypothetical protein
MLLSPELLLSERYEELDEDERDDDDLELLADSRSSRRPA